ncbi:MAG: hypothetical protein JF588_13090 [Caulobacterales bacterium]|nr:hypothetical protein [Caulobacterales bacterium]
MAKPPPAPRPPGSPDSRFRTQIEAALAEGVAREDMTLRLTLRDATLLSRDPATPVADISYAGGAMRFLGVKIEKGGVPDSVLDRGAS